MTVARWGNAVCMSLFAAVLTGCIQDDLSRADAHARTRGRLLLEQYDCGSCHLIPGVRRARGIQGPDLHAFSRRAYIAGELANEPSVLVRWIMDPPALVPDTLMPDQQVPEAHALAMSAYLMTLR